MIHSLGVKTFPPLPARPAFGYSCQIEGHDSAWFFGLWGEVGAFAMTGAVAASVADAAARMRARGA